MNLLTRLVRKVGRITNARKKHRARTSTEAQTPRQIIAEKYGEEIAQELASNKSCGEKLPLITLVPRNAHLLEIKNALFSATQHENIVLVREFAKKLVKQIPIQVGLRLAPISWIHYTGTYRYIAENPELFINAMKELRELEKERYGK